MYWLNELTAGDEVIVVSAYANTETIERVTRTTNTQIIVGNRRFRKKDGRLVGQTGYRATRLREPTPDSLRAVRDELQRRRLVLRLSQVNWNQIDTDTLAAVAALLPGSEGT